MVKNIAYVISSGDWYDRLVTIEKKLRASRKLATGRTIFKVIQSPFPWRDQHPDSGPFFRQISNYGWPQSIQKQIGAHSPPHRCPFPQGKLAKAQWILNWRLVGMIRIIIIRVGTTRTAKTILPPWTSNGSAISTRSCGCLLPSTSTCNNSRSGCTRC